jgi:hypothetical protein
VSEPRAPRRPSAPQAALDALLAENSAGSAGDSIRRALRLDELDRQLRPLLPPTLAPHARLANFERGRLVFVVDASVWRAKLRLAAPELLDAARSVGLEATELVVKITSPSAEPASPPPAIRRSKPISAAAQKDLQAALASLQQPDPSGSDDAA